MTRRAAPLLTLVAPLVSLVALVLAILPACAPSDDANTVVLYSSVDDGVIRPILAEFERRRGVKVLLVGDTEATKTTGLVQRVFAERDRPRADVWWSSEALGTVKLSNAGLLAPYASKSNEADFQGGWPRMLRGIDGDWYGFALRPRVFVYHTGRVPPDQVPATLVDLTHQRLKGKVGIAQPAFGTTRGHIAALRLLAGSAAVDAWLAALQANGCRYYDGNAAVVRAVAQGEIDVGLTDADDVVAGKANRWPIEAAYERQGSPSASESAFGLLASGTGTLMTPNTVAIVKGARHVQSATALVDFLLSPEVERMLARSDSGNVPVRPMLAREFPLLSPPSPVLIDWESVIDPG